MLGGRNIKKKKLHWHCHLCDSKATWTENGEENCKKTIQKTTYQYENIGNIFALHKFSVCVCHLRLSSVLLARFVFAMPSTQSVLIFSFSMVKCCLYDYIGMCVCVCVWQCYCCSFFSLLADLFIWFVFRPISISLHIYCGQSVCCMVKIALGQMHFVLVFSLAAHIFWGKDICKHFNLSNAKNGLWLCWNEFCAHYNKSWDQRCSSNTNI